MNNETLRDWVEYELVNDDYLAAASRIALHVQLRGDWVIRAGSLPEHDCDRLRIALAAYGCDAEVDGNWLTVVRMQAVRREDMRITREEPPVPMMKLVYGGCR